MNSIRCPGCLCVLINRPPSCPVCGRLLSPDDIEAAEKAALAPEYWIRPSKLPPEILNWARQNFNEEEILAGIREIEETGGLELKDIIHELEQEVNRRE